MLITTTHSLEGWRIREYMGIVSGERPVGAYPVRAFFSALGDLVRARAIPRGRVLSHARDLAMEDMATKARELGANAVVGLQIGYTPLGRGAPIVLVAVCGTAVKAVSEGEIG